MSKRQLYDNYRVEVFTPKPWGAEGDHKRMLRHTRELEKEIQRHIDHEGTSIEVDSVPECEFCGYHWTEESDDYNGGCCEKDEENKP